MWIAIWQINPNFKFSHPDFFKLYLSWNTVCIPKSGKSLCVLFANNCKADMCNQHPGQGEKHCQTSLSPSPSELLIRHPCPPLVSSCACGLHSVLWVGRLWNSYKWNHGLHCFVICHSKAWLWDSSKPLRVVYRIVFHCKKIQHLFIHSVGRHVAHFHFGAVTVNAAMNFFIHACILACEREVS